MHTGASGYAHAARELTAATEELKAFVDTLEGVTLVGCPSLAIVPLQGEGGLNVYALATLLEKKGWGMFTGQKPASLGIPIGERTPKLLPQLKKDLQEAVAMLREDPSIKPEGTAAVYGAAASIPEQILEDVLRGYVDVKLKVKPAVANGSGHVGNGHAKKAD